MSDETFEFIVLQNYLSNKSTNGLGFRSNDVVWMISP